jgi:endonuclease-3
MAPKNVRTLFKRFAAANPAPTTELEYATPYQLLVAVILSAQATDKSVNQATKALFLDAATPQAMLELGEELLARRIARIGLFRSKARNIVAMSRMLLEQHGGDVPRSREALEALPGVGRKTASVVLNTVFNEPAIAVDTHVFRVANRTGLAPGRNVHDVETGLLKAVPARYRHHAHHWLLLHGRYICKAAKPACADCPIRDLCEWPEKST